MTRTRIADARQQRRSKTHRVLQSWSQSMSNFLRVCRRPSALKGDVAVARLRGEPGSQAARTRAGFPCFARVRPGWLKVPSLPRGRRCPHGRSFSPAAACRISTASPCHPGLQPAPGRISDEASARVHCHSPHTSLPLACDPGRNGILGLSPELRTQPGRTRQRTSGRGQARTLPGLRLWHQPASFDVLTHNVRPHVARSGRSVR